LVLALMITGMIEASTNSETARAVHAQGGIDNVISSVPILHVLTGWKQGSNGPLPAISLAISISLNQR
jgi:hypothetical protein